MTYRTKYHRDGTVTVWNVYTQQWARVAARDLVRACEHPSGDLILPTLPANERQRIIRIAERV